MWPTAKKPIFARLSWTWNQTEGWAIVSFFFFLIVSLFGVLPSSCMPIQDHREANRSPRDLQHNAYIKSVSIPMVNMSHMTKPKSRDSVAGCPSQCSSVFHGTPHPPVSISKVLILQVCATMCDSISLDVSESQFLLLAKWRVTGLTAMA